MTFNVDFKDFYSGETNYVNVCDGQMLTNECVTNISDVKNVLNNSLLHVNRKIVIIPPVVM